MVIRVFRVALLEKAKSASSAWRYRALEVRSSPHSPSGIAAKEGIEHRLFQALLVLPTPSNHGPIAVGCVQMVAIAGKCKAVKKKKSHLYIVSLKTVLAHGDHTEMMKGG